MKENGIMGKNEKSNGITNGVAPAATPKTFERKIEHRLTQAELINLGVNHRQLLRAIDDKDKQRKSVAVTFRQDIDAMRAEEREIRVALDSGVEMRKTLCVERRNERLHTIEVVTIDDERVVDTRPMTSAERQVTLPGVDAAPPKPEMPKPKGRGRKAKAQAEAPF